MEISLKPVTSRDKEFFIDAYQAAYRSTIETMLSRWDGVEKDKFAIKAFDYPHLCIIHSGDVPIGTISLKHCDDGYIYLSEFFLWPEAQGQGIEAKVLRHCITQARSYASPIKLCILKANVRTKSFYERHGFLLRQETDIHWRLHLPFNVPEFETDRLLLKPVTQEHISSYQYHFNDYEIIRNLSAVVPWPFPDNGVKTFLFDQIFPHQGDTKWLWGIFLKSAPKELIGAVSLWRDGSPENRGILPPFSK